MPITGVTRVNAGFMSVGQTAKQFVGLIETETGGTKTQALETVTAAQKAFIELEDSAKAKVLKLEAATAGANGNSTKITVVVNAVGESNVIIESAGEGVLEESGYKAKASEIKTYFEAHTTYVTVAGAGSANKLVALPPTNLSGGAEGKTFYITDVLIASDSKESANVIDARIQANGVDIFRGGVHSLSPIDMPGIETQPFATAGQAVTLVLSQTTGKQKVWFSIFGFEQ